MNHIYKSLLIIIAFLVSFQCTANPDNPFLNGQLNLEYEGQLTGIAGEVIEIKDTKQKYPVYKLNLRLPGVGPIWVSSIGQTPDGGIIVGDMIIFKGYISSAADLDSSGELEKLINSKSLLLALRAERTK